MSTPDRPLVTCRYNNNAHAFTNECESIGVPTCTTCGGEKRVPAPTPGHSVGYGATCRVHGRSCPGHSKPCPVCAVPNPESPEA